MIGVPSGAASLHGHCTDLTSSRCLKLTPAKVGVVAAISSMIADASGQPISKPIRPAISHTTSRSCLPDRGGIVGRTRLIRRSAFGERAVLLQERRAGQEDVREPGGLVEEQVLHHEAVQRRQRRLDVPGVGVGLGDVLALDEQAAEPAVDCGVERVGDARPGVGVQCDAHRLS